MHRTVSRRSPAPSICTHGYVVLVTTATIAGHLRLSHVLAATGIDPTDVVVLRHTFTSDGLRTADDLTPSKIFDYTRRQVVDNKLGKQPPRYWLVFMADGGRRSRLLVAYENHGEVVAERDGPSRYFDLQPVELLSSLIGRLVIEWSKDTVNWAKTATSAAAFPVVEIADPEVVLFPGFDRVLITYAELLSVVSDSRYGGWRTALGSVQGVYLIADSSTGQLYVGKADGEERILGRWAAYARDGHGGNVALRALSGINPQHTTHFRFSILRVFGPSVPSAEIDQTESHFKAALLTRQFGLNRN